MYITFKGVTSDTKKCIVTYMPFVSPEERLDVRESEGKDGAEYTGLGYKPYVIPCKMTLLPDADIDDLKAWLTGSSTLLRSDDPLKKQTARVSSGINWDRVYSTREIQFGFIIADPYRYLITEANTIISSFPGAVVNSGTKESLPLLKVTGSGTVVFVINGVSIEYVFDTAYVYIDCAAMSTYYSVLDDKCRNVTFTPDQYPTLAVGSNAVTKTSGTITSIEITPRSRFI